MSISCGKWESSGFQPTGSDHARVENGFLFTARGQVREPGREWSEEEEVLHILFLLPEVQSLSSSWSGLADSLTLVLVRSDGNGGQDRSPGLSLVKGEHLVVGSLRYPLAEGNMFLARWEGGPRLHVEPLLWSLRERVATAERLARFRALKPHDELLSTVVVSE
jgi:hypothetical protein